VSWQPIDADAGLFTVEKRNRSGWSLRSNALKLSSGGLLLMSPIRDLGDLAAAALARIGTPELLLAPNHYHHLGIPEHLERHSGARVLCTEEAKPRLSRKQRALAFEDVDEVLRERLPPHATVLSPPGLKNGEVWLRVETKAGVAWLVTDAFANVVDKPTGITGLFLSLAGTAPGLRLGSLFRWAAIADRIAYRTWLLERLAQDPPKILVPAHGEPISDDGLAEQLRDLVHLRLP
jgi:hypothetical protein